MLCGGQLSILWSLTRVSRMYHRVAFIASGLNSGFLQQLAHGPIAFDKLASELHIAPTMHEGLKTWLQAGIALGELDSKSAGYCIKGKLSRTLTEQKHDAAAAFFEELAYLHNTLITQAPERPRQGQSFTLKDQNASMIARSSRLAEPIICEALAEMIPKRGPVRLLEIGCGAAGYIRYAALRNTELTALGVELQADAAALATANVSQWNLGARISIELGDIRSKTPDASFDLVTLHQNIYYFPVHERTNLLHHIRSFTKTEGQLLLTSICQGGGSTAAVLDLWGAITAGCGRIPAPKELIAQIEEAGFVNVTAKRMIPGESFYTFTGTNPDKN